MQTIRVDGMVNVAVGDVKDEAGRPMKVLAIQEFGVPLEGAPPTMVFEFTLPALIARKIGAQLQAPPGVEVSVPAIVVPAGRKS